MHFCNVCGNMFYITLEENNMVYYCRKCGNKNNNSNDDDNTRKQNIVVSKTRLESEMVNIDNINKYTKMDPTLPRTSSIKCINDKCECNVKEGISPEIIYIRKNTDDLKYVFVCCHCDTTWNNYKI